MKFLKSFIVLIIIALTTVNFAQSAWDTGYNANVSERFMEYSAEIGRVLVFNGTIDTVGTGAGTNIDYLFSNPFKIAGYDDQLSSYPPQFTGYLSGGTASTQKITCEVWGSMSRTGTYHVLDTLLSADSVTTVLQKTFTLNGNIHPWLKLKFLKATGNIDTDFDFKLYLYKKD